MYIMDVNTNYLAFEINHRRCVCGGGGGGGVDLLFSKITGSVLHYPVPQQNKIACLFL